VQYKDLHIKTYSIKIYVKEIALKEEHFYRYDYKRIKDYDKKIIEKGISK